MRHITWLISVLLFSCGPNPNISSTQPVTVDPVLQPYFDAFQTTIGYPSSGINGQFADTESNPNPLGETIGECTIYSDGTRTIQIDSGFWARADESERIQLIFHELGHCALNLQHIVTELPSGCPTSIMYPYTFGDNACYTSNLTYYFQELASHK